MNGVNRSRNSSAASGSRRSSSHRNKCRSLPESSWPLCCSQSEDDHYATPSNSCFQQRHPAKMGAKSKAAKRRHQRREAHNLQWILPQQLLVNPCSNHSDACTKSDGDRPNSIDPHLIEQCTLSAGQDFNSIDLQ